MTDYSPAILLQIVGGAFILAALLGLLASIRFTAILRNVSLGVTFLACILGSWLALEGLQASSPVLLQLGSSLPFGSLTFQLDPLSAFFLLVVCLPGAIVAIYSAGYVRHVQQPRRAGVLLFLLNLFLLAMACVVLAHDAIAFLAAWELMSLATFFLILFEHEHAASRKAAFLYVVMTHVGTAFLVAMFFGLAASAGGFGFSLMKTAAPTLSESGRTAIFLCGLVGFGIKAGIIPLHIWLPEAHPAAPTNVSALMSGVMIKTGIYGMVRIFLDILGPGPQWWGLLLLGLAVISAVLGVMYALMEHDMKRLLAFHSIENIGIILIGVGAGMLFLSLGNKPMAVIAIAAGMFHTLNHAMFKGLLFMGAGAVVQSTGTRNIEELGGLAKRMPWTSFFFLIGSVAISALPPLNGFVSEWLTYQALLLGFTMNSLAVKIAVPLSVALLALTGALAAACFVKAFGITFLGNPRSAHATNAAEAPRSMLVAMGLASVTCALLGLFPGTVLKLLAPLTASLTGESMPSHLIASPFMASMNGSGPASIAPLSIALLLGVLLFVPMLVGVMLGGKMRKREAMTWACGLRKLEPHMQYTASGFTKPLQMIFSSIYRPRHEIEVPGPASSYFRPAIRFDVSIEHVIDKYLYTTSTTAVLRLARLLRRVQTGHIQTYLAYIFVTLVILLVFAR